jgi:CheY-like chemotaxis protein
MKILIAEDESGIADTYQRFLEGRGHQVIMTKDGMQCVKAYKHTMAKLPDKSEYLTNHLPFDAVVLDYKMPTMAGLEAARLILEANKHQRIIFVLPMSCQHCRNL